MSDPSVAPLVNNPIPHLTEALEMRLPQASEPCVALLNQPRHAALISTTLTSLMSAHVDSSNSEGDTGVYCAHNLSDTDQSKLTKVRPQNSLKF